MKTSVLFPKDGITNDPGANLTDTGQHFVMCLSNKSSLSQSKKVPDNVADLVKIFVSQKQDLKEFSNVRSVSKKTPPEDEAFPLEDTDSFWTRMFSQNERKESSGERVSTMETPTCASYISFNPKENVDHSKVRKRGHMSNVRTINNHFLLIENIEGK